MRCSTLQGESQRRNSKPSNPEWFDRRTISGSIYNGPKRRKRKRRGNRRDVPQSGRKEKRKGRNGGRHRKTRGCGWRRCVFGRRRRKEKQKGRNGGRHRKTR